MNWEDEPDHEARLVQEAERQAERQLALVEGQTAETRARIAEDQERIGRDVDESLRRGEEQTRETRRIGERMRMDGGGAGASGSFAAGLARGLSLGERWARLKDRRGSGEDAYGGPLGDEAGFIDAFGGDIPQMAKGGPVEADEPVIVGERGPELFVPATPGVIVPNNKLQSEPQSQIRRFDFKGARAEGYGDAEILDRLKNLPDFRFDVDAARKEGWSDSEIAAHVEKLGPALWRNATPSTSKPSLRDRLFGKTPKVPKVEEPFGTTYPAPNLTEQEKRIFAHHRASVDTGQAGQDEDGRPITVNAVGPRVRDGKYKGLYAAVPGWVGGKRLNDDEAYEHWKDEIEQGKWPLYRSVEELNRRARTIHRLIEEDSERGMPQAARRIMSGEHPGYAPDRSIARGQLERGYRGLKQGAYSTGLVFNRGLLDQIERIERGEMLPETEDTLGYQHMTPEQRTAARKPLLDGYADQLRTIAQEAAKISALYHNPNAQEAIKAANNARWRQAWRAFAEDPVGVVQDLTLANAAQMVPMAVLGTAGAALKGVPGLMLGFAGGSFPVDYAMSLVEYLGEQGIDLRDYKAVDAKLREPGFLDKLQTYAGRHAAGVAAGDAAAVGLMRPLRGGFLRMAGTGAGNVAVGVAGESGGEALGQFAASGKVKPGDVIAEGLAAGPVAVAGTAAQTIAARRRQAAQGEPAVVADHDLRGPPDPAEQALTDVLTAEAAQAAQSRTGARPAPPQHAALPPDVQTPSAPPGAPARPTAAVESQDGLVDDAVPAAQRSAWHVEDAIARVQEAMGEQEAQRRFGSQPAPESTIDPADEVVASAERLIEQYHANPILPRAGGIAQQPSTGSDSEGRQAVPASSHEPDAPALGRTRAYDEEIEQADAAGTAASADRGKYAQMSDGMLRLVAKAGVPEARRTAQAEIERRAPAGASLLSRANPLEGLRASLPPELAADTRLVDPGDARVSTGLDRSARLFTSAFGKEVVFVDAPHDRKTGRGFDGAINPNDPTRVYVNVNSNRAWRKLLGHETLHTLKRTNPKVYSEMLRGMRGAFDFAAPGMERYQGYYEGGKFNVEELAADAFGDQMDSPAFWWQVFKSSPNARTLFHTIGMALDTLRMKLRIGERRVGFETRDFIRDIERARKAMAEAYNAWRDGREIAAPSEGLLALQSKLKGRSLAEDMEAQSAWMEREAEELGYSGVEELFTRDRDAFTRLAAQWRSEHPADALFSRTYRERYRNKVRKYEAARSEHERRALAKEEIGVLEALPKRLDHLKRDDGTRLFARGPVIGTVATIHEKGTGVHRSAEEGREPIPADILAEALDDYISDPVAVFTNPKSHPRPRNIVMLLKRLPSGSYAAVVIDPDAKLKDGTPANMIVSTHARSDLGWRIARGKGEVAYEKQTPLGPAAVAGGAGARADAADSNAEVAPPTASVRKSPTSRKLEQRAQDAATAPARASTAKSAEGKAASEAKRLVRLRGEGSDVRIGRLADAVASVVENSPFLLAGVKRVKKWVVFRDYENLYMGGQYDPAEKSIHISDTYLFKDDARSREIVAQWAAHEIAHAMDDMAYYDDEGQLWDFWHSIKHPAFAIDDVPGEGRVPKGTVMAEALNAFNNDSGRIADLLRYPFNYWNDASKGDDFFQIELFAQLTALYTTNRQEMRRLLPNGYELLEKISDEGWGRADARVVHGVGGIPREVRLDTDVAVRRADDARGANRNPQAGAERGQAAEGRQAAAARGRYLASKPQSVDGGAHEAATSPRNDLPKPTEAQLRAGVYRKGHVRVAGLDIAIENPEGSVRPWTKPDGTTGETRLAAHYGYVNATKDRTGEQIDVFVKPGTAEDYDGPVFVADTNRQGTTRPDEFKTLIGWTDADEAHQALLDNYDSEWDGLHAITAFESPAAFKRWLEEGDTTKRVSEQDVAQYGGHVAMAPGAQHVGFINDAAQPTTARNPNGKVIRREDVLIPFLKALGASVYQGRIKQAKMLGFYRPRNEEVRIRRASDLETTAHEIAHLIDDRVFNGFGSDKNRPRSRPWVVGSDARTFSRELVSVSYDRTKVYEGWAEYVRLWMTQPDKAKAAAPEFTKWFESFIEQHEYGQAVKDAQRGMLSWFAQDALNRARSKIGPQADLNEHLDGWWDRFRQATVDDLHGVYRMERMLKGENVPLGAYETSRLTRAAGSITDGALRYGAPYVEADGSIRWVGKGLEQILKPVSKSPEQLENFLLYAVGKSAKELKAQGRERLFTDGEINAMLALETPEFRRAMAAYQWWNKRILDFAEKKGLINPHTRAMWRRAQYLPFHRVGTTTERNRAGVSGNWHGIKTLTGGTENIRDVLGNIVGNANMLIDAALKNEARAKIVELAEKTPGGAQFLTAIPADARPVEIDKPQLKDKLIKAAGGNPRNPPPQLESMVDQLLANAPHLMDFLVKGQAPADGNVMAVLKDGKPFYYEVADPILFRAVQALNRPAQSALVKWLAIPKRIGQASIVLTPDFQLANIARDTLMGAVTSRTGFLPAIDSARGLIARLKNDTAYKEYIANGGGFASYLVDERALRAHLDRFYSEKGFNAKTVLDAPDKFLYFIETLFDSFEVATRLGEYKRARAQGVHPRHAAYLGREVSTDFAMKGDSQILGFFYDTVMFLRPAVVSMDRLYRGLAHDPNRGAIAAKATAIALASAALYLFNRDKEKFKDLPDWERDAYWHFFVPTPSGEELHFRYPKIWEIGALGTLAERAVERILESEPTEFARDFARVIKQQFFLNVVPQAAAPLLEQATNRRAFTGRPVEPQTLKNLQPFMRATPGTSETMRALGSATRAWPSELQVNPVRAEALLRGYLNTWATYGLMLSDAAFFSDKIPARRLDQYPVVRRFYRQEPPLDTKHEETFYELLEEARRLRNTMRQLRRAGDDAGADKIIDREPLASYSASLENTQRLLSAHRRRAESVRRSDLSPEEKSRQLDDITAEMNAVYKEAATRVRAGVKEDKASGARPEQ